MCGIVVIDDDLLFLRAIARTAAMRRDVDLFASAVVERAYQHIRSHPTRVAIVDLNMPGTSGLNVCRQLRATEPDLEILITSAAFNDDLKRTALNVGADGALDKPFDLAAIIAAAHRPRQARPHELVASHIDLAKRMARKLGRTYRSLIPSDEIEALALLGLCEAANRFDSSRTEPFAAFATRRIRGSVLDELRRQSGFTRNGRRIQRRLSEARRELEATGAVSDEDVVSRAGVSIEELVRIMPPPRALFMESIDVPSSDPDPETRVARTEIAAALEIGWKGLSPLGRTVLERHYVEGDSLAEIARSLMLPISRITHAQTSALEALRTTIRDRDVSGFRTRRTPRSS